MHTQPSVSAAQWLSPIQCSETKSKDLRFGKHWNFANGFSMLQFVQKTHSSQGGVWKHTQPYPSFGAAQRLSPIQCSETKSKDVRFGKNWNFAYALPMLQFVQKTHSARGGVRKDKVYVQCSESKLGSGEKNLEKKAPQRRYKLSNVVDKPTKSLRGFHFLNFGLEKKSPSRTP